jgi:hypothetical protein
MKVIGFNSLDVTAQATAAIVDVTAQVPIIITHPSLSGSFSLGGSASVTICGGPQRSIQVNSSSPTSLSAGSGTVDLSHAGPADSGSCTTGTGGDFGDFGGPSSQSFLSPLGSTEHYIQPADPILDPLATTVPMPVPVGPVNRAPGSVLAGSSSCGAGGGNCPCPAGGGNCPVYYPGTYTSSGIGTVGTQTVFFFPGIYYLTGPSVGVSFNVGAGGVAMMAMNAPADTGPNSTNTGWTANMLVYLTGPSAVPTCSPSSPLADQTGTINVTGSLNNLVGSPANSAYKGILFYVDRSAATAVHTLGGPGGSITMTGTIYATNTFSMMSCTTTTASQYQTVQVQGSGTQIAGDIIASALQVNGSMTMNLNPSAVTPVRQIALVNGE